MNSNDFNTNEGFHWTSVKHIFQRKVCPYCQQFWWYLAKQGAIDIHSYLASYHYSEENIQGLKQRAKNTENFYGDSEDIIQTKFNDITLGKTVMALHTSASEYYQDQFRTIQDHWTIAGTKYLPNFLSYHVQKNITFAKKFHFL